MRKRAVFSGKLKNVATAQWDFAQLRNNGYYVYVDKTCMLAKPAAQKHRHPEG